MIWIVAPWLFRLVDPFFHASAITSPPFIISRAPVENLTLVIHEEIHGKQSLETLICLYVPACVLFALLGAPWWAYLITPAIIEALGGVVTGLLFCIGYISAMRHITREVWSTHPRWSKATTLHEARKFVAYRMNPIEREAYDHESDPIYLATRRPFAWVAYVFRKGTFDPSTL